MIDLPLSKKDRELYEKTLTRSHRMRTRLELFNRNEEPIGAVGGRITGGSVQVSATTDVSRSLSVDLIDPRRTSRFEPDSPGDAALFADQFIGVEYGVLVPELERWVNVPIFMGPVTLFERRGAQVRVEAQGKERLMLAPHYAGKGYMIRKRTRVDAAIRQVAARTGEERFALPDLPAKLNRSRAVSSKSEPWKVIRGGEETSKGKLIPGVLARSGSDLEPYYDGRGRLTVRRKQSSPVFTFRTGDHGHVIDQPQITYDLETFRNVVMVAGGKRKKRKAAGARVTLPPNHPGSPQSLARNGDPRFIIEFIDRDGLRTDKACRKFRAKELGRLSREFVSASFNSLPVPHLEEDDQVALRTSDGLLTFPLESFVIPLTGGDSMSVNGTRPVGR